MSRSDLPRDVPFLVLGEKMEGSFVISSYSLNLKTIHFFVFTKWKHATACHSSIIIIM